MRPRHLVYLAALTVLLVFALTAAWEFVLEDLVTSHDGPRNPAWESTQEHWTYVLTATFAAAAAWLVSGLVSLRLVARNDRAKRDLEESEDLFRQAADMARLGHYIWDERESRHEYCSEELARLFGYGVAEYLAKYDGLDTKVEDVHPEDRARYEEAWRDSMEARRPYDVEYRALTAKGDYRHFREQGRPVIDERDRVLRWIGVVRDITESKWTEEVAHRKDVSRLAQAFQPAKIRAWCWAADTRLTQYLPCHEDVLGSRGEPVGAAALTEDRILGAVHPDDRDRLSLAWDRAYAEHTPYDVEYRIVHSDGGIRHQHEIATPEFDDAGLYLGHFGTTQDVTERKRSEEALRESEVRLRAMMDHAPFEISIKDTNGRYLLVNGQYERNYGRPKNAFEGKTPLDLFPEDFSRVYAAHDRKVLETGEAVQVEATVPLEDGVHTFMSTKFPIRDADGKTASIGSISIDITKRKLAEEALRHARDELELRVQERTGELQQANRKLTQENAERRQIEDALRRNEASLAAAQRQARIGSWRWSVERNALISCSEEFARIHGVDTSEIEDLMAREMERVIHPDDRTRIEAEYQRFDEEGVDYEIEYRIVRSDGEVRHVLEIGEAVRDETGRAVEQTGTVQDITERKEAEEALRVSQARFAGILDIAPEAIISIDEEQNIRLFNKGAEAIFGHPADEVLGRPLEMLLPPRHRAAHREHMGNFARAPEASRLMSARADVVGLRKDGTEFPAKASISKLMQDGEVIYTVSLNDVTAEKLAHQRIADLAKFPDENPQPILRVTADGLVLYANEAVRMMKGFCGPPGEGDLPEDLVEAVRQVARSKRRRELEIDLGDRIFAFVLNPVEGETYINLYARDVTEQRRAGRALEDSKNALEARVAELEEAQRKLERQGAELVQVAGDLKIARDQAEFANRAKSEFLANMSHELRTPLNAIIGFSEIIKDGTFGPTGNDKYSGYANDIHISGQHLLALINDILDLSKVESGVEELYEEDLEVADIVRLVLRLVKQRAEAGRVGLEVEMNDDIPLLHADARKVKQILVNLLTNAIKFTDPGGEVTLKAWCRDDSGFVFQVVDTGIGIKPEDIPKALSQFGQIDGDLNRKYEGTGLGLPLTKSLVELHGGSLDLQSQVGVGTVVTLRFPAARIVRSWRREDTASAPEREAS